MRLFDANELLKEYQKVCECITCEDCQFNGAWGDKGCQLEAFINNVPTIDAVPVVRCKDCLLNGTARCAMNYNGQHKWNKPNDFCSWGERKEDETD